MYKCDHKFKKDDNGDVWWSSGGNNLKECLKITHTAKILYLANWNENCRCYFVNKQDPQTPP